MSRTEIIAALSSSKLFGTCHKCGEEFKLSDTLVFDGLEPFQEEALNVKESMKLSHTTQVKKFKQKTKMADEGAEQRAISVGFGKIIEKIIPAHKDFDIPLSDCRALFEPIDMISFNGLTHNDITSLTFFEIKTGKSRLTKHERMIRDAVDNKRVFLREF